MHKEGTPLNGYTSHAEFEQQCTHCHAPMHCVTDTRCQDCHMDIAQERSATEGLHSRLPGTDRCQSCHVEHMGRDAVITEFAFANVDHTALTGFSLAQHETNYDGSSLTCESCHQQDRFLTASLDCLTCHVEEDRQYMEQHRMEYGDFCLQCHDGFDRMSAFDHNQYYLLDGKHTDCTCQECHINNQYTQTPAACKDCHEDPDLHLGEFGLDCDRCHTTTTWLEARLTRHLFDLDHGGEGRVGCVVCHTGSYAQNTCYGCHDHEEQAMNEIHAKLGLQSIQNCMECHPTGQEGEAERWMEQQASSLNGQNSQPVSEEMHPDHGKGSVNHEENSYQPGCSQPATAVGAAGVGAGR
jgi:hypothetical protein